MERRPSRRKGRAAAALVLALPALWVVGGDLLWRAGRLCALDGRHRAAYAASALGSAIFWALVLASAARKRWSGALFSAVFVVAFGASSAVQASFRALWSYYCSFDSLYTSTSVWAALFGDLPLSKPRVAAAFGLSFGVAIAFVLAARTLVRPSRSQALAASVLASAALLGAPFAPASYHELQASTPDLIYAHALSSVASRARSGATAPIRAERRSPEDVPRLRSAPQRPRNVLFLLQESERFDAACTAFDPACERATQATNHLFPARKPLLEMRALDAATAISAFTLWTGLAPNAPKDVAFKAPLLWEYARAAGFDTAYWTSQHLQFEGMRLFLEDVPFDHFACATNLDPAADFMTGADDFAVTDRAIEEWASLREPFFAVVHYSNVHLPYKVTPDLAPFVPYDTTPPADRNPLLVNTYKDAIYRSDAAMAKLLEYVRLTEKGSRTVVIATADHGEALRERGFGHTFSLFDEAVHVPTWIDAPPGTLAPEEERAIDAARDAPTFHVDLTATALDLMGVWDDAAMRPFRARLPGHPLTREERTTAPIPLSGCAWVWQCAYPSWGVMQGTKKLVAWAGDPHYRCFDVGADPGERRKGSPEDCNGLLDVARALFPAPEDARAPFMPLEGGARAP